MNFCSSCGTRLPEHSRFCASCGASVTTAPVTTSVTAPVTTSVTAPVTAPVTTSVTATPEASPPTSNVPQASQFAWSGEFVSGDWAGAVKAVGIAFAAMTGLAFIATLLAHTGAQPLGIGELIGRMTTLVGLAAGGSLKISGGDFGGGGDLSFRPLGLTFLGFTIIAILFVRRLRQRGMLGRAALAMQAGRVGVILLGGLFIFALLSRTGGGSSKTGATYVEPISAMFGGLVTLVIALAVAATVMLPGVLPPRAERYRVLVAAPLRAVLILIVASCAFAMVVAVLWTVTTIADFKELADAGDFWRSVISSILLMLPNLAAAALLFGIGVPATGSYAFSSGTDGGSSGSVSILDAVAEDPRFWLWALVAIALVFLTGVLSARWSPNGPNGRPIGYWLGVVLPVVLFILGLNLSASASGGTMGMMWLSGTAGFDYLFIILLGGMLGVGAGMLGSALVRRQVVARAVEPPSFTPHP